MVEINTKLLWIMAIIFVALTIGSIARLIALRDSTADVVKQRLSSLKVWWILAVLWTAAILSGQLYVAILLAIASFLGLREFARLIGTTKQTGLLSIIFLVVFGTIHYGFIVSGSMATAKWLFPIGLLLGLAAFRATNCDTSDYIRITAGLFWGAMLLIYGLSHALFLFEIGIDREPSVGTVGWFLYLILLTEVNDIAQAIVGRKFGKHRITPRVSPNKTLEGLLGGVTVTVAVSIASAPFLTTLMDTEQLAPGVWLSVTAGLMISLVGFLGDINMSAVKRDAGVKDGGSLLPGMGGVIDRVDSLTFTAPAFYYFVYLIR